MKQPVFRMISPVRLSQPRPFSRQYRLGSIGDDPDDISPEGASSQPVAAEQEELPYRVELWDEGKVSVEQVLAVTASGAIGYAAYYAATRELPHRYITLRFKSSILARWNAIEH